MIGFGVIFMPALFPQLQSFISISISTVRFRCGWNKYRARVIFRRKQSWHRKCIWTGWTYQVSWRWLYSIKCNNQFLSFSSAEPDTLQILADVHVCKKSMDLEIQIQQLMVKLKRSEALCKEKANRINKLNALVSYYQKRAKTLKDIISNLKSQELISEHAEQVLNVRSINQM